MNRPPPPEAGLLDPAAWRIVNDGVMGGVSSSRVAQAPGGALRFEGEVRLDFNGGFASVRRPWPALPSDATGVAVRVRGDGNRYRLTVYTRDAATGAPHGWHHYGVFDTTAGAATHAAIPWDALRATYRGRPVPQAPRPAPADVVALGFMITKADHRAGAGPFALDVLDLGAATAAVPGASPSVPS